MSISKTKYQVTHWYLNIILNVVSDNHVHYMTLLKFLHIPFPKSSHVNILLLLAHLNMAFVPFR